VSQTGTSMSALLEQTMPTRPPSWKRRAAIGVAVVVVLGAAGAVGTMVGTTAANSDAGREAPAATPRTGDPPRADEREEIDEPPPEQTSATASASATLPPPVHAPRPHRKAPAKDAPTKDDDNWDPFQNRK
jgi:hypothetical protein